MEFAKEFSYLFENELIQEIDKYKVVKKYHQNDVIIEVGDQLESVPFILEGAIKILKEDKNGEELLLYYLEAGDTCSMTISTGMGKNKSKIRAVVEEEATVLFIPLNKSFEWLGKYDSWRNFIFSNYEAKFIELLEAIDSLAFSNMEERVLKYLSDKAKVLGTLELSNTHQDIAEDLHSSRVVISRILKKLEQDSKLKIHRNRILLFEI